MTDALYLGLDIGTSCVKAVIIDGSGQAAAQASAPLTVSRPHRLWSEQDPDDWWAATNAAIGSLPVGARKRVRGNGLAGQRHGATVLDRDHRVLRPAILWNDGRAADQCAALEAAVPDLRAITGNQAMPGFTAPKLAWLRHHEPALFSAIAMVLLPKEAIRIIGGGSRSAYLGRLLAAALDTAIVYREGSDVGPAFGAARLARLAAGNAGIAEVCMPPRIIQVIAPDPALVEHFARRQPAFRALYAALHPLFRKDERSAGQSFSV